MVDDFLSICLDSRYNQNNLVLMSQSKLRVIKARIVEKDMERANQNWKLITARIVEKDMESTEQSRITPHFPSCTSKKIWQKKKKNGDGNSQRRQYVECKFNGSKSYKDARLKHRSVIDID